MSEIVPEPFIDPQAELGIARGHPRARRRFMQGQPARPLDEHSTTQPAQRGDVLGCLLELRRVGDVLEELVEVDSGESIAVRKKLILSAAKPFDTFLVEAPDQFHSVKVDNPTAVEAEIVFGATQPSAANSDERVPRHSGRIITAPYDELAIGFDPAVIPGGNSFLYCIFYSRPYPPASYAFV